MARPKVFNVDDIIVALDAYVDETNDPIIPEFTSRYGINKSHLHELSANNPALADSIKRLVEKQEAAIVRNVVEGKSNPIFAIFRLKQKCHGWSDKTEVETTVKQDITMMSDEDKQKRIDELRAKMAQK
jgi:hypothetical protein